jgi:hypothetical protein
MKAFPSGQRERPKEKKPHYLRMYAPHLREAEEIRPPPLRPCGALMGHAAAMEEYRHFKAAGMLAEWRRRWRDVLNPD